MIAFRDLTVAALLKLVQDASVDPAVGAFRDLTVAALLKPCGLPKLVEFLRPFRDLTVAALLKHILFVCANMVVWLFPRPYCRGPIEASRVP